MFHAFLRYVFGIQPLFLVLMLQVSSVSEKECLQNRYLNILRHHLGKLVNTSERLDGECRQSNTEGLICNATQKIYNMACKLKKLSNCTMNADLKKNMISVYNHTFSLLQACKKEEKRRQRTNTCQKSNSTFSCHIKKTICKFKLCWMQYMNLT
ncbi:interleukin-7 [Heteronotia binoei]|uniref:interleukin-7 n=1 Tax=Heteronotia binoei TaxID=13085 RepID=UPI0029305895|nr:interleukin-7 [Heteronotia binoei]